MCLSSRHRVLSSTPGLAEMAVAVHTPVTPALRRWRQEDQMFKVILDIGSSRPAWATGDLVSETKQPVGKNQAVELVSIAQSYPRRPENCTPCDSGFLG